MVLRTQFWGNAMSHCPYTRHCTPIIPAPLHLQTLWRYTNAVIITIIISTLPSSLSRYFITIYLCYKTRRSTVQCVNVSISFHSFVSVACAVPVWRWLLFRAAITVIRNPNLQEIWDVHTHPNVTVMKGNIKFLENAKLCLSLINEFMAHVHIVSGKQPVVSQTTNGYSAICTYACFFHV